MPAIEIIAGDHEVGPDKANWPFMSVNRAGLHVDLSKVPGELWGPAVASVGYGYRDRDGREFGIVWLKNGDKRIFANKDMLRPYLTAYAARKIEEDAKHAANVQAAIDADEAAMAEAAKRDAEREIITITALDVGGM